jgi:multidrug efflux pump subunit AcrB
MLHYFIDNPRVVLLIMIALVVGGLMSMGSMRREAYPNVDFAQAKVTTRYPGATPEEIEQRITVKIEDELREIDGIKEVRSVSQEGYSEVKSIIDIDKADSRQVIQDCQRAIDQIGDLPADLPDPPLFEEIKTKNMPVLEVSVAGEVDELILRREADRLEATLESDPGVAAVDKIGYRDREYRIYLDPASMRRMHVGFPEVINAVRERIANIPGGTFESRPHEMSVRAMIDIESADDLLDVVVRTNLSNQVVRIGDVGTVESGFEEARVIARTDGAPAIILVVKKKEMADIVRVTESLLADIQRFATSLPAGMRVVVSNDEAERTRNRLDIIVSNAMLGFGLLLGALMIFLNFKTALVTSISVPVVVLTTLIGMQWMGITFNLISMMAIVIALGMFVDNSIVISENIFRHKNELGEDIHVAARAGVHEIAAPITATVLTTIASFVPMFVTSGVMGQFIWAIPAVVAMSLLASLGDSFALLPTRIIAFGRGMEDRELGWYVKLQSLFRRLVETLIRFRWATVVAANLLLVATFVFAARYLDFVLFPPEGIDRFVVRYEAEVGVPIEEVNRQIERVEEKILALPKTELKALTTRTGVQQVGLNDPLARTGGNIGMMIVYLTPETERERDAFAIIDELRRTIPVAPPFASIQFERIANGPPVGKPVTVSVLGEDMETLKEIAAKLRAELGRRDGVFDIDQDLKPGLEELRVVLHDDATADYGLTVADIAGTIRSAQEGTIASTILRYGDDIDVRVLFSAQARGERDSLENMPILNRMGHLIPLRNVATIERTPGPETRRHFNYLRSITVTADVDTKIATSLEVNRSIRTSFAAIADDYPGYRIKFGGEEESTNESMASLASAMVIAVLAIFGILVALFGSFFKPFLIMFSIPFGFIGTIAGFALHDKPMGFLAMIGVIGLAGVVVNSAIVLVSFIDALRREGTLDFHQCLVEGACIRLRPILLTTATTVAALFPTAYGLGGWDPMLVPMTLAMAWGLLTGTILTLLVVPPAYAVMEDTFALGRGLLLKYFG